MQRCINSRLKNVLPEKGVTMPSEVFMEIARAQEAANCKQDK